MLRQPSAQVSDVRVRIAPSPTGIPHIGNTRTALFNYLFAKHSGGKFILRIEDTDQARIIPGAEKAISEILDWLHLIPDETYKQSQRLDIYRKASQILLQHKFAREDEGAVRFIVPKEKTVSWEDAVGNKHISFNRDDIEDFVIFKSDGFPTYHLASVVDDYKMKITHVIRGDEWISSTPKHILLYEAFGWQHPIFAHLPVILGPDKTKLSKRHGAESVLQYRDQGYLKEALLNFMALLGWNPGGNREIMSLDEMIDLFDLKDVNTASPMFDIKKLEWMNGAYIRQLSAEELKLEVKTFDKLSASSKKLKVDDNRLDKIIPLVQSRMKKLKDFLELVLPFFETTSVVLTDKEKQVAKKLKNEFLTIKPFNKEAILTFLKKVCDEQHVKMPVIYRILTGKDSGLPLPDMLEIVGKEETLRRLKGL